MDIDAGEIMEAQAITARHERMAVAMWGARKIALENSLPDNAWPSWAELDGDNQTHWGHLARIADEARGE